MIYLILGMHKSGTTLISQILHKSGIDMGKFDELGDYDSGNQFERKETQRINMEILGCGDNLSLSVKQKIESNQISHQLIDKINNLISNLNDNHNSWGFKDPRTCLTYDIWKNHLAEHKIIFVYRSPYEVWLHYRKQINKLKILKRLINGWRALSAWYIYNSLILSIIGNAEHKFVCINYSKLMENNKELLKLEKFLSIKIVDCREKRLYRSKYSKNSLFQLTIWAQKYLKNKDIDKLFREIDTACKNYNIKIL